MTNVLLLLLNVEKKKEKIECKESFFFNHFNILHLLHFVLL